uniref:Uncharacterized protein n=1 Tax=Anguilla anguilla TaxID=7936 RepID=A0A0E9TU52_ANGAN
MEICCRFHCKRQLQNTSCSQLMFLLEPLTHGSACLTSRYITASRLDFALQNKQGG